MTIVTVQDRGWAGIKNGKLLKLVAEEFDIFITSDKNLRYQQNLNVLNLVVILLPSNQIPVIKALLPAIDAAIQNIGDEKFIEISHSRH